MRPALRCDLTAALKARDRHAVNALRSALAAIENAETPDVDDGVHGVDLNQHVAGSAAGLGATEVPRRPLSESELRAIVDTEIDERTDAAAGYEHLGESERADRLRTEAELLRRYVRPIP